MNLFLYTKYMVVKGVGCRIVFFLKSSLYSNLSIKTVGLKVSHLHHHHDPAHHLNRAPTGKRGPVSSARLGTKLGRLRKIESDEKYGKNYKGCSVLLCYCHTVPFCFGLYSLVNVKVCNSQIVSRNLYHLT